MNVNVSAHSARGAAAWPGWPDPPAPRHLHHRLEEQTGAQGRGAEADQRRDQGPEAAAGGGGELESLSCHHRGKPRTAVRLLSFQNQPREMKTIQL